MTATGARTMHVEHCMGTVFSIDIRDAGDWTDAVGAVVRWLHHVDAVFSTYRPDSDISRMRRGELRLLDADPDVHRVLAHCADAQLTTGGRFTGMPGGRLDPTGLVKGWAVEQASGKLCGHGADNHAVNGGGDVQLAGEAAPGLPWAVGLVDPHDRSRVLRTVAGRNFAVASSGTVERGAHIIDPFTGGPAIGPAGVAVTGPSLTLADAYATAAFVMGADALTWIDSVPDYAALLIATDGTVRTSSRWPSG
jgi:thiamine biosynthesis lipoprotein